MSDRPILFRPEMVRAILEGRKTETRRLYKPGARCSFEPGQVLWVRESFHVARDGRVYYRADGTPDPLTPWKPSIHMPRKYCRLELRTTSVWVQRLQDISEDQALAEGAKDRAAFARLWDRINGSKEGASWDDSPFVWRVCFEVVA